MPLYLYIDMFHSLAFTMFWKRFQSNASMLILEIQVMTIVLS